MNKTIPLIALFLSTGLLAESNLIKAFKNNKLQHDFFNCPTQSETKPCKLVCTTPGNPNHFVKSEILKLQITIKEDNSFALQGKTYPAKRLSEDTNNTFYGYFTRETNCMLFGLKLTDTLNNQ